MPFGYCIKTDDVEENADTNLVALKPENFLAQVGAKVAVLCVQVVSV